MVRQAVCLDLLVTIEGCSKEDSMSVSTNLDQIKQQIEYSCHQANRSPDEITIIAVTKYVTIDRTKKVIEAGVNHIAENRDQGLLEKQSAISNQDTRWHFIGNLQSKKVKKVINEVDYFHALDRLSLAEEINKRAIKKIRCFVQVNISGETSKSGLAPHEVEDFIVDLSTYSTIEVIGLMTMAPFTSDEDTLRHVFRSLRVLRDQIALKAYSHAPCTELSMGMSNDYHIAVEEGATYIRIGSKLVGTEG